MPRAKSDLKVFATSCIILLAAGVASSHASVSPGSTEAQKQKGQPIEIESLTQVLGGKERYLTSISTDKPIYKTGQTVYFRGILLDGQKNTPLPEQKHLIAVIQIRGPRNNFITECICRVTDSIWTFAWRIPNEQSGGEYTVTSHYSDGFAPATRKFDIRAYRAPRLTSQIKFLHDGYGPGEKVSATLDVKRVEGGIPEGAKVSVDARVDGVSIKDASAIVDSSGQWKITFDLPKEIPHGEGTLALSIEDGGTVETASKTIPILLRNLDIQFYPEGGDLVAGFKNRVYVQATQPNGKPADVIASITSEQEPDSAVVQFQTAHEGRGKFQFTPVAGQKYLLKVSKPVGITKEFPLPQVKSAGAIIQTAENIVRKNQPLTLRLGGTQEKYRVRVCKREVELASALWTKQKSQKGIRHLSPLSIPLPATANGVLTVTVFGAGDVPLAERLIYREPASVIKVSMHSDKDSYIPGEQPNVTVRTTDENGKPISAVVGVTVTDDSILQMVDKREQAPQLPVMLFLEPEVKDLADAHVYLDSSNPKASLATDLLLGTQGWRRFALFDVEKFVATCGDSAKRALALREGHGTRFNRPTAGTNARLTNARIGEVGEHPSIWTIEDPKPLLKLPEEFGRVEGPRDMNLFQVEPSVIDERHYTSGRAERHQKTSPTLPEGAPPPDDDDMGLSQIGSVDRYTFFPEIGASRTNYVNGAIRIYAHQVRKGRKPTDRIDFRDTLYWNAALKTDPKTGEGKFQFGLNDSVTTFRILADAFSRAGSVGASSIGLKSAQPFYAEAKLPLEVTTGDKLWLPVSLINASNSVLKNVEVSVKIFGQFKILPLIDAIVQLQSNQRKRCIQPIEVGSYAGTTQVTLAAKAGAFEDKVERTLSVKPNGFPIEKTFGGLLAPNKSVAVKVSVEKDVVRESMAASASVFPSPVASLTSALERLIQEPNGCFEQTSSTSYPLTMAQQYFMTHSNVDPRIVKESREKLERGYQRLVSFWCPDRGYEWFGQNPGHPALTAYGLLHFNDMAKVKINVDRNMMNATRTWLLHQRDGKGGWNSGAGSHGWAADKDSVNAYILWALLETGEGSAEFKTELASLKYAVATTKNTYVLALAANVFELSGDRPEATKLMQRLAHLQKPDGSVDGITHTIVGGWGEAPQIEGTALATLAWMRQPAFANNVGNSIKYLANSCKSGRYGSTQSTVLALRAIVRYEELCGKPKSPGKVRLYIDGKPIGAAVPFEKTTDSAINLPVPSGPLVPGEHKLEVRMEGGSVMPYALTMTYNTLTPASDSECKLDLDVSCSRAKLVEGTSTDAVATITNKTKEALPTPIAIVGVPGGLEPRHDQLKELVKRGTIDAYEVRGREIVLYWRGIAGNAKARVPLSLIAAVPGRYTAPASRAYLYYTDEHKKWVEPIRVEIAAKH